jgi:hypothetical protein
MEARIFEGSESEEEYRYTWDFYLATKNDAGVSGLVPLTLKTGEDKTIEVSYINSAYDLVPRNTLYPFVISDRSVFDIEDWTREGDVLILKTKALKKGTTNVSIVYRDTSNKFYYTTPIQVVVEDPVIPTPQDPSQGSGGGGGCNIGYGLIGLLFMGLAIRKYLTL